MTQYFVICMCLIYFCLCRPIKTVVFRTRKLDFRKRDRNYEIGLTGRLHAMPSFRRRVMHLLFICHCECLLKLILQVILGALSHNIVLAMTSIVLLKYK